MALSVAIPQYEENKIRIELGKELAALRSKYNVTILELADAVYKKSTEANFINAMNSIARIEAGQNLPRFSMLYKMLEYYEQFPTTEREMNVLKAQQHSILAKTQVIYNKYRYIGKKKGVKQATALCQEFGKELAYIGKEFRALRIQSEIFTQSRAAVLSGLSKNAIGNIETGRNFSKPMNYVTLLSNYEDGNRKDLLAAYLIKTLKAYGIAKANSRKKWHKKEKPLCDAVIADAQRELSLEKKTA